MDVSSQHEYNHVGLSLNIGVYQNKEYHHEHIRIEQSDVVYLHNFVIAFVSDNISIWPLNLLLTIGSTVCTYLVIKPML